MIILASEIKQLQQIYNKIVKARYQKIKKQYKYFVVKIEIFKEKLKVKKKR